MPPFFSLEVVVKAAFFATAAIISVAGCASAAPVAGSRLSLTGELHIKGNEPFPMAVLQLDDGATWEVSGVAIAEARGLAGRRVTATGTVVRAPGADTWLPSLRADPNGIVPAPGK